jgi:4-hydroxybenzoyl-CoA reductase subunit beta
MLKLPPITVLQPRNRDELFDAIKNHENGFKLFGGGTDLINGMKKRLYPVSSLISLKKIASLRGLSYNQSQDQLHIGAMTTLSELAASPATLKAQTAIADTANMIAAPPIRNQATVGGNLCLDTRCYYYNQSESWRKLTAPCFKCGGKVCNAAPGSKACRAVFSADLPPLLIALDTKITINGNAGEKTILLKDFYTGKGATPTVLKDDEYISEITISNLKARKSIYKKFRLRKALDFPLAGVALSFDDNPDGKFINPKIILNAVASGPLEVPEAAALLAGKTFTDEQAIAAAAEMASKAAKPIANIGSKPFYRKKMVGLLLKKTALALAGKEEA